MDGEILWKLKFCGNCKTFKYNVKGGKNKNKMEPDRETKREPPSITGNRQRLLEGRPAEGALGEGREGGQGWDEPRVLHARDETLTSAPETNKRKENL